MVGAADITVRPDVYPPVFGGNVTIRGGVHVCGRFAEKSLIY